MNNTAGIVIILILISNFLYSQDISLTVGAKTRFDFSGSRSNTPQFYTMQSELISYTLHGSRQGKDIFRLQLKYTPGDTEAGDAIITCLRFTIQQGDSSEAEIPALKNWTYKFCKTETGAQKGSEMFGIPHSAFENLKDQNNKSLPPEKEYHVYNAFIDFHSFCDVFSENHETGTSVKDLHYIGDKIKHCSSNSEAPVNLRGKIEEGSTFKNGTITLQFTGISYINNQPCALINYDSGESSFKMIMSPVPGIKINISGTSHYFGSIYRNVLNNWMQKATLHEFVTSETLMPFEPKNLTGIAERVITVENVDELK